MYVAFENSLHVFPLNQEWIKTVISSLNILIHGFKVVVFLIQETKKKLLSLNTVTPSCILCNVVVLLLYEFKD